MEQDSKIIKISNIMSGGRLSISNLFLLNDKNQIIELLDQVEIRNNPLELYLKNQSKISFSFSNSNNSNSDKDLNLY